MIGCDVTIFEVELEQEKIEKIADVATRGAAIAAELGQELEAVSDFLSHYFRHVDPLDIDERSVEDLLGLVESHYRLAMQRPPARATIAIRTPSQSEDGWSAGGATVVQIVTDDRPFLVDSVTMEVLRQGWSIREVFHPQFLIRRDVGGTLREIVRTTQVGPDPEILQESWMHLEVLPPASPERDTEDLHSDLEHGLLEVLRLVEEVVEDWSRMRTRSTETISLLADPVVTSDRTDEAALAIELLEWLNDNHFTFLGYRQYRLILNGQDTRFEPVAATGLGVLRGDKDAASAFHAVPMPEASQPLMIITKDNDKSRVHRPAYLDYIGIRTFSADGQITGERRFLGLFASSAYSEPVSRVPVLRQKAAVVLRRSGYAGNSHGGKAIMDALDNYPRDELFQAPIDELAPIVEKVAHLKERRQVRMFVRREPYGRYLSCLVYLPRDRYTTAVRKRMEEVLLERLQGASIDYTPRISESVLARLHFVVRMPLGKSLGEIDVRQLERELTTATRSWSDEFAEVLAGWPSPIEYATPDQLAALAGALPEGYKEDFSPRQAVLDLAALMVLRTRQDSAEAPGSAGMEMAMYAPDREDDEADLRLKIFRWTAPISLSQILPHLTLLGVDVIDERPYELVVGNGTRAFIYDFGITVPGGREAVTSRWSMAARQQFIEAFSASYQGLSEPDGFHALVMRADLTWRQVVIIRAIGRYLRQVGSTYSQTYLAHALSSNVDLTRQLVTLFELRFDPRRDLPVEDRKTSAAELINKFKIALNDVASLDHDRILRSYLAVIGAIVRTNAFQGRPAIAFKLLPRQLPELPEPRPAFEIFVYSPRVEGVHLRFGPVARGGVRWSDRAEDFRTEILGLVKAQMVKNTVIVPVGAKGGFYCKRLPDASVDRDAWMSEGMSCYELFIASLLDVTDNLVTGEVIPPTDLVRYDGDDPYLVVAADKGTATFSDLANSIAISSGFWLGDAFASGGSAGYDHKAMGITARGAWESVRRHFREMGTDCQAEDFSCVGIGDMSGDVFGNGMLLSKHIRLIAAFDHRHIFVDPTPDAALSWQERRRLFDLPRSSWADYDKALISEGGGVFPRNAKSVLVTAQMHKALGIPASIPELSPSELISACLKAPADLLFNGGVGTFVKATTETNAHVGDKANDGVRVDGCDLRVRCVGEGGNLGFTQRGRIEYAGRGGRINTDFIDNSGGVNTSDHEVNIKILLSNEVSTGRLTMEERDAFLASMTDEVAEQVLGSNYNQNLALANSVYHSASMAGVHEDWMERLENSSLLDRELEALPSTEEMENRRSSHRGLTSPELATLLAYTKIVLEDEILNSDLPDDPYVADRLVNYFPSAMRERYAAVMANHRLRREITATVVVNEFVDASGITCFHRLSAETGASAADIIRAQIAARAIFDAGHQERTICDFDHRIDAQTQTGLRMEVRTVVERATRWLINNRQRPLDIAAAVDQLSAGVQQVRDTLPTLLPTREREAYDKRMQNYRSAGVPEELASVIAALPSAYPALTIVQTAARDGLEPIAVAEVHFTLGHRLGLDRLISRIVELPRDDRWQTMARAALRDDMHAAHAQLTAEVLSRDGSGTAKELVAVWERKTPNVAESVKILRSVCAGRPDLARMSVGLRIVRGLLSTPTA